MFTKVRILLPALLVIIAVGDAVTTRYISDPLISGGPWSRFTWDKLDTMHQSQLLFFGGLQRDLDAPRWIGNPGHNNNIPLKVATFYNVQAMRNRFHVDFARHPLLLPMALGNDRIWFSNHAVIGRPLDAAYRTFVKRSEEVGAPVIAVHPRAEMAEISHSGFDISWAKATAPSDVEEINSINQLPPATRIHAQVLRYTPDHLDLQVDCPSDGWLLVTDRWASGWKAKVNGQAEEVYGGDFIFRAVRVRAGENNVQFYYQQRLYFALFLLSWCTLATVVAVSMIKQPFSAI